MKCILPSIFCYVFPTILAIIIFESQIILYVSDPLYNSAFTRPFHTNSIRRSKHHTNVFNSDTESIFDTNTNPKFVTRFLSAFSKPIHTDSISHSNNCTFHLESHSGPFLSFIRFSKVIHTLEIFGIVGTFLSMIFSSESHRILFLGQLLDVFSLGNSGMMIFQV